MFPDLHSSPETPPAAPAVPAVPVVPPPAAPAVPAVSAVPPPGAPVCPSRTAVPPPGVLDSPPGVPDSPAPATHQIPVADSAASVSQDDRPSAFSQALFNPKHTEYHSICWYYLMTQAQAKDSCSLTSMQVLGKFLDLSQELYKNI